MMEVDIKKNGVGHIIRKIRTDQKLTQDQLGQLCGVKKAHISKIENNLKDMRFSTIIKVFNALDTDIKLKITPNNE